MNPIASVPRSVRTPKAGGPPIGLYLAAAASGSVIASPARADTLTAVTPQNWPTQWVWEPAIVAALFVTAALYRSGLHWIRRATRARGKLRRAAVWFWSGWLVL